VSTLDTVGMSKRMFIIIIINIIIIISYILFVPKHGLPGEKVTMVSYDKKIYYNEYKVLI